MRDYSLAIVALMVVGIATTVNAQQRPAGPPPAARPTPTPAAAPATPPATVALPTSKMAVIYTDVFLDQKTGIVKFNNLLAKLNSEFSKLKDEINALQQRAQALETE